MDDSIGEDFEVLEIAHKGQVFCLHPVKKRVISEMSLKIVINGDEYASLLCLNQHQEDLALGFLYSEGVIDTFDDIDSIAYNDRLSTVVIQLREGIHIGYQESLRSMTSGCGKCYTYINPLKQDKYQAVAENRTFPLMDILANMRKFEKLSEIYSTIGGVHSVLYLCDDFQVLNEDIGRHNCVDKITGILLRSSTLKDVENGMMFISGRISSEIMTKIIRLGVPVLVSRSTPTAAAVKLAEKYNVTLLGYVRRRSGYIYTCPSRITV